MMSLRLKPSDPLAKAISGLTEFMAVLYRAGKDDAAEVVKQALATVMERRHFDAESFRTLLEEAAGKVFEDDPDRGEEVLEEISDFISEIVTITT